MSGTRGGDAGRAPADAADEPVRPVLLSARAIRRKRAPKALLPAALAVVVVGVAGFLVFKAVRPAQETTRYVTGTVERGTLTLSASGNGSVIVAKASSVAPQVSGTVRDLKVRLGSKVKAGDELFEIENDTLDDQVTQALAQYRQAQSSLIKAEQGIDQAEQQLAQATLQVKQKENALDSLEGKEAAKPGSVTDAEFDVAKEEIEIAEKGVSIAEQGVDAAESSYSASKAGRQSSYNSWQQAIKTAAKRTVTAPISGVITSLNIQDGDSLGGGGSTSSGGSSSGGSSSGGSSSGSSSGGSSSSAALVISDLGTMQAQVSVSEVDRAKVKTGQKATMTFDAVTDLTLTGKVETIDAVGTNSQGVVTYNVSITFDAVDDRITPGMTTAAAITTDVRTDVLSVPRSAVKSDSNGSYVLVMADGAKTPTRMAVETGASTDSATEITSGLSEGDAIVTQSITPNATATSGTGNRSGGMGGGAAGMGGGVRMMVR